MEKYSPLYKALKEVNVQPIRHAMTDFIYRFANKIGSEEWETIEYLLDLLITQRNGADSFLRILYLEIGKVWGR